MRILRLIAPYLLLSKKEFYCKKLVIFVMALCYLPLSVAIIVVLLVVYFLYFLVFLVVEILKKTLKM